MEDNPLTAADDGSDVEIEYDEDGNPIPPSKKKFIDPLPPIDHSEIQYEPFEKNFYTPHEDIEKLSNEQVEELKKNLGVKVRYIIYIRKLSKKDLINKNYHTIFNFAYFIA